MTTASEPIRDEIPGEVALLGLDYGRVRVGVAVSTPEQTLAVPLETWEPTGEKDEDAGHLEDDVRAESVHALLDFTEPHPQRPGAAEREAARDSASEQLTSHGKGRFGPARAVIWQARTRARPERAVSVLGNGGKARNGMRAYLL